MNPVIVKKCAPMNDIAITAGRPIRLPIWTTAGRTIQPGGRSGEMVG
jgi:hypothetical protein